MKLSAVPLSRDAHVAGERTGVPGMPLAPGAPLGPAGPATPG